MKNTKRTSHRERAGLTLLVGLLLGACTDGVVEPKTGVNEQAGEIRTVGSFAALKLQIEPGSGLTVDSVLAGPAGAGRLFAAVSENQIVIINPKGEDIGQVVRFRIFTAPGTRADGVKLSFLESAKASGALEVPAGSIVWSP